MRIRIIIFLLLQLSLFTGVQSQVTRIRELTAKRTVQHVKIDGVLSDPAWNDAATMDSMTDFRVKIGALEDYGNRTEALLMYDDHGIYFGGFCHERTKDSIARELKGRDGFGTNDYIGIIFDTYLDRINGFEYFLTPLNEQWDAKVTPANNNNGGEDFSWNSVWKSAAIIHDSGWSFEMFIPYSAIRFGKDGVQDWGLNITRRRRKTEQQYTWNPINPNINGFLTQEGIWKGIRDIKPPLRLQLSPYFSVYANHFPASNGEKSWTSQVNGGMDLKWGINQAFTLDATLIPDFGQVQSDNQVLNLTPFEVKFNENRTFFNEGTELFSKGNLFYSRRIGGTPLHLFDAYDQVSDQEIVVRNPSESKMINASKISGRTQGGLGIGFLNAITKPQYATIENQHSKEQRKYETDPLTNYSILVLDQTLKNNSSVTFINTNVLRSGADYDANVTAGLFNLNDKKNTWNINGKIAHSNLLNYLPDGKNQGGFNTQLQFGKISGRFNFNIWQEATDTKYSHNDLGYFTNNNYLDHGFYAGYRWTEPKGWYNRIFLNLNANTSRLYSPFNGIEEKFQRTNINFNANAQTKKLTWLGYFMGFSTVQNDFYEPRQAGFYFRRGASLSIGGWFESNSAKKYSYFFEAFVRKYLDFYNMLAIEFQLGQNYRINSKLSLSHRILLEPRFNSIGYASIDNGEPVFGKRQVNTIENLLTIKYNFNNRMGINFRARHYLSSVENEEYFRLIKATGKLSPNAYTGPSADQNVNFFNIDMVYTWQFAPGSFLNVVWKDAAFTYHSEVEKSYFRNFSNTWKADQNNNISLKVIYFLDYLQLKKR